jgi:hypothetical protein
MLNDKYGLWEAGDKSFDNKYQALVHASNTKQIVRFWYHDDVLEKFDRSLLGRVSLKTLYRERAQQLRDKYDYLILYYSGGADSHNVLKSFIDNDIHLDEVCVKWPEQLMNGKFYETNSFNTSAENYWSEWDYCVKPILEWLKDNRPKIKIHIKDFIGDPSSCAQLLDYSFETIANHGFKAGILLHSQVSDSEIEMLNKGKTVGNIYGIDKPILSVVNRDTTPILKMFFSDEALRTVVTSSNNPTGAEVFYWTPDLPLLAFEQAYQLYNYYKINKKHQQFLLYAGHPSVALAGQAQQDIAKNIIYDTWDNRFQVMKDTNNSKLGRYYWLFGHTELTIIKEKFIDNIVNRMSSVGDYLVTTSEFNGVTMKAPKVSISKGHTIGNL